MTPPQTIPASAVTPGHRGRHTDEFEAAARVETIRDPWMEVPAILARIPSHAFASRDYVATDYGAVGDGRTDDHAALVRTMATAGRTVVFSAVTVGLAMLPMALFPMYFLKSFAYAGVAVVSFAALAAIVVTPAAIVVLGPRLDALSLGRLGRRRAGESSTPVPRCGRHRLSGHKIKFNQAAKRVEGWKSRRASSGLL